MKNFKIAKKLLVAFGGVLAMLILACVVALIGLSSVGNNLTSFYERPFQVTNKASDLQRSIQAAAKNIGYATMSADVQKTKEYIDGAQAELAKLKEGADFMKSNFSKPELIDEFLNIMDGSVEIKEKVFEYAGSNQNDEAIELYFSEYQPILLSGMNVLAEINDTSMENADNLYRNANASKQVVLIILIVVAVLAITITIILALYLTKSLTAPIHEIETAAAKLSKGDLEIQITYESQDELGELAKSFTATATILKSIIHDMNELLRTMAGSDFDIKTKAEESYLGDFRPLLDSLNTISYGLSDTLNEINESTSQVSVAASQMAESSTSLAEGATEQASSIEELLATVENVKNDTEKSAANSEKSAEVMEEIGNKAEASSEQMTQLIGAMDKINDSSKEIAAIINTIEEIAEQTNLLSLNASIEAARAGEAGKGFAVVAGEIGKLATQSAEAVNNTRQLIETALREVKNGTGMSETTAKSLFEMKDSITEAVQMTEAAKKAALTQSAMMNEINGGIEQISQVVQNNSATAEESSATSEELSAQAETVTGLVKQFKLRLR